MSSSSNWFKSIFGPSDALNKSIADQLGAQQSVGGGIGGQLLGTGHYFTSTLTVPDLTAEEKEELKKLLEEHELEQKYKKLEEFKKLPAEMRQFYINVMTINTAVKQVNNVTVEKSSRLMDLEARNSIFGIHRNYITNGTSFMPQYEPVKYDVKALIAEIEDLSLEELFKAHTEACMEEALVGTEDEKV
jgi:hypothetical protein